MSSTLSSDKDVSHPSSLSPRDPADFCKTRHPLWFRWLDMLLLAFMNPMPSIAVSSEEGARWCVGDEMGSAFLGLALYHKDYWGCSELHYME